MKLMERIRNYIKKALTTPPPMPNYLVRKENFTGTENGTTYENASYDIRNIKVCGYGFTNITTWHGGKITAGDFHCAKWEDGEFAGGLLRCGWSGDWRRCGLPGWNDGWMGGLFSGDKLVCTYWHDGLFTGNALDCSEWRKGEFKGGRLTCGKFESGTCSARVAEVDEWENGVFTGGTLVVKKWHNGTFEGDTFHGKWYGGVWKGKYFKGIDLSGSGLGLAREQEDRRTE